MRKLFTTLCLTIAVLLGSTGILWSADFGKGLEAYERRDYAIALRELIPLAERGHADAKERLKELKVKVEKEQDVARGKLVVVTTKNIFEGGLLSRHL